jgi:DNA-binding NarL/FixJ family response regulator
MTNAPSIVEKPSPRMNILIGEATRMGCELLVGILARHELFQVVGWACTLNDILQLSTRTVVDVAIVSVNLEDGPLRGLDVTRELRRSSPNTRVLLILDRPQRDLVIEAFRTGPKGVFFRNDSSENLRKAILSVYQGQIWAGSRELECLVEALASGAQPPIRNVKGEVLLSRREEEIVWLVAEGLSNREISGRLKLSEHTVKNYLFRVFDKLGISSRSELIVYVLGRRVMGLPQASPSAQ